MLHFSYWKNFQWQSKLSVNITNIVECNLEHALIAWNSKCKKYCRLVTLNCLRLLRFVSDWGSSVPFQFCVRSPVDILTFGSCKIFDLFEMFSDFNISLMKMSDLSYSSKVLSKNVFDLKLTPKTVFCAIITFSDFIVECRPCP